MRSSSLVIILGVMLVGLLLPMNVQAATTMTLSPSPQTISQLQTATYNIGISSSLVSTDFTMDVSGVVGAFTSNPVTTDATGMASVQLIADASTPPTYCPGTYSFTVTASGGGDTATIGGVLTVIQVGPPLQVTVFTDKPTYRIGDVITVSISISRPAEGQVLVTPPSGSPVTYQFTEPSSGTGAVTTFTAQTIGTYSVTAQADDYCSGFSSAQTTFTVNPNTYDVAVSISGVPSQYSATLQVDGQNQGTVQGSQTKTLSFPIGSSHTVMVDQYVTGDKGVRYYSSQNSWSVSSADSHTFNYETQYQFSVSADPNGVTPTTGGGWYSNGASVQTNQAPQTVQGSSGSQYVFKDWELDGAAQSGSQISVTMDKPHTAVAKYTTQYQLVVDSPGGIGDPQGAGYHDAGSTATFSVTSPVGFLIQQVFARWEGDYTGSSPQGSVTMDGPKTVHAVWTTSYTQLYIAAGVAVVAIIAVAIYMTRRKRKGPAREKKPTPSAAGVKCASCGTENLAGLKFCTNCGEKLSKRGKHHT